ncbi:putative membrane protein [Caballeronia insecticola]|uniref:Putative membrane protein n=2 Tax=Caballeronia insecticola TaxID=758793 RepID=R4WIA1_9BURK|nr:putative membrane protein [Caballeronia insecticola]
MGAETGHVAAPFLPHPKSIMKRFAGLCLAAWSAAALLYFGRHSAALIVLSGVLALAGFDLVRPESDHNA